MIQTPKLVNPIALNLKGIQKVFAALTTSALSSGLFKDPAAIRQVLTAQDSLQQIIETYENDPGNYESSRLGGSAVPASVGSGEAKKETVPRSRKPRTIKPAANGSGINEPVIPGIDN